MQICHYDELQSISTTMTYGKGHLEETCNPRRCSEFNLHLTVLSLEVVL